MGCAYGRRSGQAAEGAWRAVADPEGARALLTFPPAPIWLLRRRRRRRHKHPAAPPLREWGSDLLGAGKGGGWRPRIDQHPW
jgi:hypothetical protein